MGCCRCEVDVYRAMDLEVVFELFNGCDLRSTFLATISQKFL